MLRALQEDDDPLSLISHSIRFQHLSSLLRLFGITRAEDQRSYARDLFEAIYICALSSSPKKSAPDLLRVGQTHGAIDLQNFATPNRHPMSEPVLQRLRMALNLIIGLCCGPEATPYSAMFERMSRRVQIHTDGDLVFQLSHRQQRLACQILFGNLCQLIANGREVTPDLLTSLESLLTGMDSRRLLPDQLVMTIFCMRLETETFQHLITKLLGLDLGQWTMSCLLLARTAVDAAMDFATEQHGNDAVVLWAADIDEKFQNLVRGASDEPRTPCGKELRTSYQWDDSIAEWIARTPGTIRQDKGVPLMPSEKGSSARVDRHTEHPLSSNRAERRPALASLPANVTGHSANRLKRKSSSHGFTVHMDGDFVYKKPKRTVMLDDDASVMSVDHPSSDRNDLSRQLARFVDEESEDELSLMAW
jgi:hypothetical protein